MNKTIRKQIVERAGGKCEACGVADAAYGARDRFGNWHDENDIHGMNSDVGMHFFGEDWDWKMIRIRLQVSELTYQALCQRCHMQWLREHDQRAMPPRKPKAQVEMEFPY